MPSALSGRRHISFTVMSHKNKNPESQVIE